jgi:hypothetical protein
MTELEAAEKLCAVLNEIEQAGYQVHATYGNIDVAAIDVIAPRWDDEPWKVRLP